MNRVEFGEKLRNRRRARGITLQQMSLACKASFTYLSALERGGITRPSYPRLRGIARGYQLPFDHVLEAYYPARIEWRGEMQQK